jgi:hypothetical protein
VDIGQAIAAMRAGASVRRPVVWEPDVKAWYVPARAGYKEHLEILLRDGEITWWTPGNWDLLASDYEIVPGSKPA